MTAVDFLIQEIEYFGIDTKFLTNTIEQAKEMEKQQIIDAYWEGGENIQQAEIYYNEIYGSKGSDETKTN